MAALNLCSGCGENFATMELFNKHRTGEFSKGTRHCLTQEEMSTYGWILVVDTVYKPIRDGVIRGVPTPTWFTPEIWQKRQGLKQRLLERRL